MPQFARPDTDIDNEGSWAATPLNEKIDEVSPSDADLIAAPVTATADTCTIGLSTVTDPVSSSDHTLRYRFNKSGSGGATYTLHVTLRQDTTVIATWTHLLVPSTWSTENQTLDSGEADSITDYSDLNLLFNAARTSGGGGRNVQVSWAEFEVPDAAAGGGHAGTAVNAPAPLKSKLQGLVT